jgi:hypothetical protein
MLLRFYAFMILCFYDSMLLYVSMILCFYVSIIKPSLVFSHFLGFVIREVGLNRARGFIYLSV